jgi:hypothetical protein
MFGMTGFALLEMIVCPEHVILKHCIYAEESDNQQKEPFNVELRDSSLRSE